MKFSFFIKLLILLGFFSLEVKAQTLSNSTYDIGSVSLREIYVDSVNGSDGNSGDSPTNALFSIAEAWRKIPQGRILNETGYRINVLPGNYSREMLPNYWEEKYGTREHPIILRALGELGSVTFEGDINVYDVHYFYLMGIKISAGGDAFHCEQCSFILLRNVELDGGDKLAHETLKVNQSQYIYIEDSNIYGADDNAIDFVAVQYGHVVRNKIHHADDWCIYTKGGSGYILLEANEIYDCGTGGYTAGQGSGFEFMVSPWLHYEAYDIKFVNNIIHHTEGAGFGVNGGYNILLAQNTLYHVGSRSHAVEIVFGYRSCDGNSYECDNRHGLGGWGPAQVNSDENPIPNKNIFVYNNIIYNPLPFQSAYQHFAIYGPRVPNIGLNIPSPTYDDQNLQIKGNILWNGPVDLYLGVGEEEQACTSNNPSCNIAQLQGENTINMFEPNLINPSSGDFRPTVNSNIFSVPVFSIPAFMGGDRQSSPQAAMGNLENNIVYDRGGQFRNNGNRVAGAYLNNMSELNPPPGNPIVPNDPPDNLGPRDRSAPSIKTASKSNYKVKKGGKLTLNAKVIDNIAVKEVWALIQNQKIILKKVKKEKYSGSAKISLIKGRYSMRLYARDFSDNISSRQLGDLTVK